MATREVWAWRKRLLPFVLAILSLLILAFLALVANEIWQVRSYVYAEPTQRIDSVLEYANSLMANPETRNKIEVARWASLTALEFAALDSRYRQARAVLVFNIFTRFLGFVTGMILSLVGAVFIVGQMGDEGAEVDIKAPGIASALVKGTPGLILATLGVLLMLTTIIKSFTVEVQDAQVFSDYRYYSSAASQSGSQFGEWNADSASKPDTSRGLILLPPAKGGTQ